MYGICLGIGKSQSSDIERFDRILSITVLTVLPRNFIPVRGFRHHTDPIW